MKRVILVSSLLFMFACQGNQGQAQILRQQKAEQDSLWKKVMDVHDEIMPEMSTINRLSSRIEELLEKKELDPDTRKALENSLRNLEEAGDDMWAWMAGLKVLPNLRKDSLPHEQIMKQLRGDSQSIRKVSSDMESSIAEAESLLEQLEKATTKANPINQ